MNPWLSIPLADYEAHMASPDVEQARLLADVLETEIRTHAPSSLAILGCAGGNGLHRIPPGSELRVVAVDINPDYVSAAERRFAAELPNAEFLVHDLESSAPHTRPVDLVFAALLFEYLDPEKALSNLCPLLREGGLLTALLQLPSSAKAAITPSPYRSLLALDGFLHLVPPGRFEALAAEAGLACIGTETLRSPAGKEFEVLRFRKGSLG